MEPRLRTTQKHSGQGFFELFVPDPPWGDRLQGGGDYRTGRRMKKISYHT